MSDRVLAERMALLLTADDLQYRGNVRSTANCIAPVSLRPRLAEFTAPD